MAKANSDKYSVADKGLFKSVYQPTAVAEQQSAKSNKVVS